MRKVLITTVPFADKDRYPLDLLEKNNIEYVINPLNRKLKEEELAEMVLDFDVIIAGTENISEKVMNNARKLKHISRVGIGLDSVDLITARNKGIQVSYTPDAPAPAVSELTIGIMLSLLRSTNIANTRMHNKKWERFFGRRISEITIGIIGTGRIGLNVIRQLQSFNPKQILVNDINSSIRYQENLNIKHVNKQFLYQNADVISLHVPLTPDTKNMITDSELRSMKEDAIIINTSRGGIINESDLSTVLKQGHLSAAAIDVFQDEPYYGDLTEIENCFLTSHMGSMSIDCRTRMEIEATEEAVRFITGKPLEGLVPNEEFEAQSQGL